MNTLGCLLVLAGAVLCASANDGWVAAGGRYFKFFDKPMTFAGARATCNGLGGVIAYDDVPEVNRLLAKSKKTQWIGATDAGHEGKWTWNNGNPVTKSQSHWFPHEPNNCCGGQNCAVTNFRTPGAWDDQQCNLKHPFHCQVHRVGYKYGLPTCVLKLHTERKTWADAFATCRGEGAQLVIVDRKDINDWIAKEVDIKLGGVWIGATDQGHEGTFRWANGNTASKEWWAPKEPNNCCGGQNCAVSNHGKPGQWDDRKCSQKLPFVCQVNF